MTATEEITDSEAYAAGVAAYADPSFVPCPFPAGSRLAQLWFDGRYDAEHAAQLILLNDGD